MIAAERGKRIIVRSGSTSAFGDHIYNKIQYYSLCDIPNLINWSYEFLWDSRMSFFSF